LADSPGAAHDAPAAGAAPSLADQVQALARELPGLVSDRVELLSLELQRAAQSLLQVVALIVAIAILGVTVWLSLWAAAVHLLMQAGLPMLGALLLTVGVNAVVIALALVRVRSLLPRLQLPATRRHLMVAPDPIPAPETRADERRTAPV
jgi:uncharacterized membrane protein YqjE